MVDDAPCIQIKCDITDEKITCMLDTGSTKTMIIRSKVNKNANIIRNSIYTMKSANNAVFQTLGSVFTLAYVSRKSFPLIFDVVEDHIFPKSWDAVIGFDVLGRCILNSIDKTLTLIDNSGKSFFTSDEQNVNNDRLRKLISLIDVSHLSHDNQNKLINLCIEFSDVFYLPEFDTLKATNVLTHTVELKTDVPVFVKQYSVPHHYKTVMKEIALKLLKDGIIRETVSPYNFPVVLVKKKIVDNKQQYRFCINFKKLNEVLKDTFYPLPKINDLFDKFKNSKVFSALDLSDSFLQIPVAEEDQEKLSFTVPECGRFCYTRVPFGLQSSSFVFQKMIEIAMKPLSDHIVCYIDDGILHTDSIESNLNSLFRVFSQMRKCNLSLNPSKCQFLRTELTFLGHLIGPKGVSIQDNRVQAISTYQRPRNMTELRAFIAFVGFYRNHIKHFAEIAEDLFKILRKPTIFQWSEEAEISFRALKKCVINPPVLKFPDFNRQFLIHCDASQYALGGVLSQIYETGEHPIHFASKTLSKAQRKLSTFEREFMAIIFALETFKHYVLGGQQFILFTDQKSLIHAIGQPFEFCNDKLNRYKIKLTPFDFKICHIEGKKNITADFLSRINRFEDKAIFVKDDKIFPLQSMSLNKAEEFSVMALTRQKKSDDNKKIELIFDDFLNSKLMNKTLSNIKWFNTPCDLSKNQIFIFLSVDMSDCPDIFKNTLKNKQLLLENFLTVNNINFLTFRNTKTCFVNTFSIFKLIRLIKDKCVECKYDKISIIVPALTSVPFFIFREMTKFIFNNIPVQVSLFKHNVQEIVDKITKFDIIKANHDTLLGGHAGIKRTLNRIYDSNFHWKNIRADVNNFINGCVICNTSKITRHVKIPMCVTSTADKCFAKLYVDTVGKLPTTQNNNNYLLTVKDDLSKFVFAIPMVNQTSEEIAEALMTHVFLVVGFPVVLISDNHQSFNSNLLTQFCKLLKVKKVNISIFHQQANSVERVHREIAQYFRAFVDKQGIEWDRLIPFATFCHNTQKNYTGFSPFEIVFARKAELPSNDNRVYTYDDYVSQLKFLLAKTNEIVKAQDKIMKEKNKAYYDKNAAELDLKVGDEVFIENVAIGEGQNLQQKYRGPCKVLQVLNDFNVKILDRNRHVIVHKNLLKKYLH